jgi:hypothetical protein
MSLIEKKYKKLVKELLFIYSELEYTTEAAKDTHSDFEAYYQQYCIDNNVPLEDLQNKNAQKIEEVFKGKEQKTDEEGIIQFDKPEKTNDPVNKIFQKMYRIIAKKLHPDKFSNREKTVEVLEKIEHFKQATQAYNDRNWAKFLDICEKYDITPTRYEKVNLAIKEEIDKTNQKIRNIKLQFSWKLYQCEGNRSCKDDVMKEFIRQLFGYKVKENVIRI